jgi:hypothetical protein
VFPSTAQLAPITQAFVDALAARSAVTLASSTLHEALAR